MIYNEIARCLCSATLRPAAAQDAPEGLRRKVCDAGAQETAASRREGRGGAAAQDAPKSLRRKVRDARPQEVAATPQIPAAATSKDAHQGAHCGRFVITELRDIGVDEPSNDSCPGSNAPSEGLSFGDVCTAQLYKRGAKGNGRNNICMTM